MLSQKLYYLTGYLQLDKYICLHPLMEDCPLYWSGNLDPSDTINRVLPIVFLSSKPSTRINKDLVFTLGRILLISFWIWSFGYIFIEISWVPPSHCIIVYIKVTTSKSLIAPLQNWWNYRTTWPTNLFHCLDAIDFILIELSLHQYYHICTKIGIWICWYIV